MTFRYLAVGLSASLFCLAVGTYLVWAGDLRRHQARRRRQGRKGWIG